MDFKLELTKKINEFENKMKEYLPEETGYQKTIFQAMNYSLNAGGKRLRPILLMESYKICGGNDNNYFPYSVAIEMIHTYSLIHDDLPALDNDDLRRGKQTNHKVFGEAMAILAGDALLSHAFQIMLGAGMNTNYPDRALNATYEISKGAGIYGMIAGQVADVESEGKKIDKEKLDFIHINKTAAMIIACMRSGAILAGASEEKLNALTVYGKKIGLAFQIIDDILDIEGDEIIMGKKTGSDLENNKSTYPAILGMKESKKIAGELIKESKDALKVFNGDTEFLLSLADYIMSRSN
ncbi:polyprenyl synthetase family protein [Peptostreptococcus canis]|uniref:Polyprenyl synthetase family protein n=1 Tax=Peptostreptococcus canis TaxID=1159213 RepID=A0ABR6TM49_9FIRM|nr:farnesyl diphosphate synthase [Peptostreptococcus canis]MBC2576493.1 polyprenyl synthetase family protein [Peptostreptococcus canis]MBP1998671.1 geranylgeranyl diphosphate synthase type II [Peptostreptococcus canis]